ncbi:MAG: HypC/HybG/HupF family hydrogenase formation chaperone [Verrucomicrobia bacterium]|nr:HypC/HybG/HupF family hydrogenase formation chaperone [Verrucomicrobiota bacterium]
MCLAVPGKILRVIGDDPLSRAAQVSFGGLLKVVNLACVPEARPGDYVIVHVGVAISTLDENEANRVFHCLEQLESAAHSQHEDPKL